MTNTDTLTEADFLAFLYNDATQEREDQVGAVARAVKARGGLVALHEARWDKPRVRAAIRRAQAEARRWVLRGGTHH